MKKTIQFGFICLLSSVTFFSVAQIEQVKWQKIYGGSGEDGGRAIKQTQDGGYISISYSYSSDQDVHSYYSGEDGYIVRMNQNGDTLWTRVIGGNANDYARDIVETHDGGFAVTLYSYANDGDLDTNRGNLDAWLIKLSPAGAIQWKKSYGGSDHDALYSLKQTSDKGFILAGYSSSTDMDVVGNHDGTDDFWVVKTDSLGNMQWNKCYGGTDTDDATYVNETPDGNFYVVGYTSSNDSDLTANYGYYDYWVIKLNATGTLLWQKNFGGTDDDRAYAVIATSDNGCLVTGYSKSNDNDVTDHHGNFGADMWVLKLDANGTIIWKKSYGGTDGDYCYSAVQTYDGNFVLAGSSYSNDGDIGKNNGSEDACLVKISTQGAVLWTEVLGGSGYEYIRSVIEDTNNNLIFTGVSTSSNGDVVQNKGLEDSWVVNLYCNTPVQAAICVLTVDSATGRNLIVWENNFPPHISKVNIYRETKVANADTLIGTVAVNALSEYVDTDPSVNTAMRAYKYRIAAVDTCGTEWEKSPYHRTIHLAASRGATQGQVNLQWGEYLGVSVSTYECFRKTNGTPAISVFQSAGGTTSWTDFSAPQTDTVLYYLVASVPPCVSSKSYFESRSNTAKQAIVIPTGVIKEQQSALVFNLMPNPAKEQCTVSIETPEKQSVSLKLFNVRGQLLHEETWTTNVGHNDYTLQLSAYLKGVYSIQLISGNNNVVKKLVIE